MTHQSTIAVLENRISCICSGYREREITPGLTGRGKSRWLVVSRHFLPWPLLLFHPKRRTLSSTHLHVARIIAFSEVKPSSKKEKDILACGSQRLTKQLKDKGNSLLLCLTFLVSIRNLTWGYLKDQNTAWWRWQTSSLVCSNMSVKKMW